MKKFNRQEFFEDLNKQGFDIQNNPIFLDEVKETSYERIVFTINDDIAILCFTVVKGEVVNCYVTTKYEISGNVSLDCALQIIKDTYQI